jgi:hypothetical protein
MAFVPVAVRNADNAFTATQTGPFSDKGGAVFNLRGYGTGIVMAGEDITDALEAAIAAAVAAAPAQAPSIAPKGAVAGIVQIPAGRGIVTRGITVPEGVLIRGAGRHNTQLVVQIASNPTTTDAFTFSPATSGHAFGGGLQDMHIFGAHADCRDVVHLLGGADMLFSQVQIFGGGRYGIYFNDNAIDCTMISCKATSSYVSGLRIAGVAPSTTFRAFGSYFTNPYTGPAVDVAGIGMLFSGCVFESAGAEAGARTLTDTVGARVRWGTATFDGCYFENNAGHDIHCGTEDNVNKTSVAITNPLYMPGPYEVAGKAFLYADRAHFADLRGGNMGSAAIPVLVSATGEAQCELHVSARMYPNEITLASGNHWRSMTRLWYNGSSDPAVGFYTHGRVVVGAGTPEGNVYAAPGWTYQNATGGTGTSLYVKRTAATSNTGWHAIA